MLLTGPKGAGEIFLPHVDHHVKQPSRKWVHGNNLFEVCLERKKPCFEFSSQS